MRRFTYLSAPLFLIMASAAYAAENAAVAEKKGMPQMDATWFANGFVWLAISFLVFYFAISRKVVPMIAGVLDERERAIGGAIREAELAKQEAEKTRGSAASEGNTARAKAAEIIAKAQAKISRDATDATAKLDRELAQRIGHVAAVLEDSVAKAKKGIDDAAADLAKAMVEKLTAGTESEESNAPKLKLAKS